MNTAVRICEEMDKIGEFLINRAHPDGEVEAFYEFGYNILKKARERDETYHNPDLAAASLEQDLSNIYLALHCMIYDMGH